MTVERQKADEYLQKLNRLFQSNPKALDSWVYQTLVKQHDSQERANRLMSDIEQLRNQIQQAEARFRSLDLQLAEAQGRANGYTDLLIASEFDKAVAPEVVPKPPEKKKGKVSTPKHEAK